MQQWLLILRPARAAMLTEGPTPHEQQTVAAHFAFWQSLAQQGIAALVGRTQTSDERTLGLAVFFAENEAAARALCGSDPAVRHKVMHFDVLPYRVAILADERTLAGLRA